MTTLTRFAQQQKQQARAVFVDAAWGGAVPEELMHLATQAGMSTSEADAQIARINGARTDATTATTLAQRRREATKAQAHSNVTRARVNAAIAQLEAEADAAAFDAESTRRALHEAESAAQRVLALYDEGLLPAARLPKEVLTLIERRERERRTAEAQSAMIAATNERNRMRDRVRALEAHLRHLPVSVDHRQQAARIEGQLERERAALDEAEMRRRRAERAFTKAREA